MPITKLPGGGLGWTYARPHRINRSCEFTGVKIDGKVIVARSHSYRDVFYACDVLEDGSLGRMDAVPMNPARLKQAKERP